MVIKTNTFQTEHEAFLAESERIQDSHDKLMVRKTWRTINHFSFFLVPCKVDNRAFLTERQHLREEVNMMTQKCEKLDHESSKTPTVQHSFKNSKLNPPKLHKNTVIVAALYRAPRKPHTCSKKFGF